MSRRGGPAPCFFCDLILPTPDEWKAHNRSCWAGYKDAPEPSERTSASVHTIKREAYATDETCANGCVAANDQSIGSESRSTASISLLLVLKKTAWMSSVRYEHIGSVFAAHNLSTCSQLQCIPQQQFEMVLQNIQEPLIEGRLRKLRAAAK